MILFLLLFSKLLLLLELLLKMLLIKFEINDDEFEVKEVEEEEKVECA